MPKLVGKTLKLCLAVLVNTLLLEKITLAVEETPVTINQTSNSLLVQNPVARSTDVMLQVTSVSQLSDVQPTDWAFQALQSLVERYGCIAGYPDGTYRGNSDFDEIRIWLFISQLLKKVNSSSCNSNFIAIFCK